MTDVSQAKTTVMTPGSGVLKVRSITLLKELPEQVRRSERDVTADSPLDGKYFGPRGSNLYFPLTDLFLSPELVLRN